VSLPCHESGPAALNGLFVSRLAARAPAAIALALTWLGAAASHAAPYVPDPGSQAYAAVLFAGSDLDLAKDCTLTGDVHGNADVTLSSGTTLDGDLSAVGNVTLGGAIVTGSVSSPVEPRQLPALPTVEEARLLATTTPATAEPAAAACWSSRPGPRSSFQLRVAGSPSLTQPAKRTLRLR